MSSKEVDQFVRGLLTSGPFDPPETWQERGANDCLKRIADINANDDYDDLDKEVDTEYEVHLMRSYMISFVFGGEDPFDVPRKELEHALKYPVNQVFNAAEHRAKVSNANRAIRAKCMECQGLNQQFIRDCTTINCQLWPFRLGQNPFFGRLVGINEDTEIVDTEEEIEAMEAQRTVTVEAKVTERGDT